MLTLRKAFSKIEVSSAVNKSQKSYMWMLELSAKENGIESTTRFRRKKDIKRGNRNLAVNDRRARSGRRGGWASQQSFKLRRDSQLAAVLQASQKCEHAGYLGFEYPQSALPFYATPSSYQPYFPPPPPQQFPAQMTESHNYNDSVAYTGQQQTAQLGSSRSSAMWPALTPTMAKHPTGHYSDY